MASNSSFAGAQLLLGVEIVVLAVVTLLLLWHYADNTVPRLVLWNVGISWFLGFLGTLLLPFDLALSSSSLDDGVPQGILSAWQLIYWVTWIMSWVVLPVLLEFEVSGEFTTGRRLLNAVRANVWLYLAGAAAVGVFVAVQRATDGGDSGDGGVAFLIAAGNAYGVLLVIVLLGTGVVALPMRARRRADWLAEPGGATMRNCLEQRAVALDDERHEVDSALAEVAGRARVCCRQVAAAAEAAAAAASSATARRRTAEDTAMAAGLLSQSQFALQLLDVVVAAGLFDDECGAGEEAAPRTPVGGGTKSEKSGGARSPSRVASSFSVSSALAAVQRAHDNLQHALSAGGAAAASAAQQRSGSAGSSRSAPKRVPESASRNELVAVHRGAKAALRRRRRNFACWSALLAEHDKMETDSRAGALPSELQARSGAAGCQSQRGTCWRVAAVLAALISLLVCWCEATVGIDRAGGGAGAGDNTTHSATGANAVANATRTSWAVSPLGAAATSLVSVGAVGEGGTGAGARAAAMQLLLLLPYVYVSVAIYAALFDTRFFGSYSLIGSTRPHAQLLSQLQSSVRSGRWRCTRSASRAATPAPAPALVGGGLSDASALLVNAMYQCRLQFALAYNFLLALHLPTVLLDGTAFVNFYRLGMDVVPVLGADGLTLYAPLAMLLIALITLLRSVRSARYGGPNRGACCSCTALARDEGALSLRAPLAPHGAGESAEQGRRRIDGAKLIQIRQRHRRNRNRVAVQGQDDDGSTGGCCELEMQRITIREVPTRRL